VTPPHDPASAHRQRALELEREIENLSERLTRLRQELAAELASVNDQAGGKCEVPQAEPLAPVDRYSSPTAKIALFRSLFTGRDDAYAVRWTSARTGRSGWSPAVRGGYYSDSMTDADLLPLDDDVIERHLTGKNAEAGPTRLPCRPLSSIAGRHLRLLACDFDGGHWREDDLAYSTACELSASNLQPRCRVRARGRRVDLLRPGGDGSAARPSARRYCGKR